MSDLAPLIDAFRLAGEDPGQILAEDTAHLLAYDHQIVGLQSIPGVVVFAKNERNVIKAQITIVKGFTIAQPIHLCFSLLDRFGGQNVELDLTVQAGASAAVWSHCLFAHAERAFHAMQARVQIQENASLNYQESHYHGMSGGISVRPRARIALDKDARYRSDFSLLLGRVGLLDVDYVVDVGPGAAAELTSRVYGHVADEIRMREQMNLDGERARGLIKSRIAVEDEASAQVLGIMHGNAAGARGHVDCLEIVKGRGVVSAIPEVRVSHPQAKVTHEAAIGSVDPKQFETLLARGLDPDEAVDRIILGILT
ncbi:SufB/SufD family protein [Methylococcus geothermalis]|uniref:FeS assembly protein SufBD n=1 Tax=Methylococcus geothermalis TaxID=2681310 RepID=A0A858QA27_9GAMM|nr:SufD family Fe-S cluster assembly protein [Methylococcus geothermalis]QJD30536.1 FeS assembly protein SufBD [Methylococcus geothermalis]